MLESWLIVPKSNEGNVALSPKSKGIYNVKYFIHGSDCQKGNTLVINTDYVKVTLTVSLTRFHFLNIIVVFYTDI